MKKNALTVTLIICLVLAAALVLSIAGFVSAKSDVAKLTARIEALEAENQALLAQTSIPSAPVYTDVDVPDEVVSSSADTDAYYCTLMIESWSYENGKLTITAFAQANLPGCTKANAKLELCKGDTALESVDIMLDSGEAEGIFEAEAANISFSVPAMGANDELLLWLKVDPMNGGSVLDCGAVWYLENNQLMLVAG